MGYESFISGYIEMSNRMCIKQTKEAINSFEFDEIWPFTNIFWCDSPAQYHSLLGIAGCYKQVEEAWSEWLWKFSQLLSRLEAIEARVTLDSRLGSQTWLLKPEVICSNCYRWPDTLIGQKWFITKARKEDLDFYMYMGTWSAFDELSAVNAETGERENDKWDKFVETWPSEET